MMRICYRQLFLQTKRADGILMKVGSRKPGCRVVNHESHSLGIVMSRTVNGLQSERIGSRRCEPISGANLFQVNILFLLIQPPIGLRTKEGTAPPLIASRS